MLSREPTLERLAIARSLLLEPFGLDETVLSEALGAIGTHRIDDADLYFQYTRSEGWSLEEGIVKSGSFGIDQGVGVRAVAGEKTAFAYSDDISEAALLDAARTVRTIAAAGQIEGGIQQGIGHALYEDYQIDMTTGRSLNANFVDYKMPLAMDMPPIRTIILETAPDPGGPFGAKGVGEDPIVAIGPAIANAVYDAIGVRFRHYPIRPEQVLQALREKAAATLAMNEIAT